MLSSAEARERAKGKPWSFLHISKPEIDLDPAIDPYDRAVYAKAAENIDRMIAAGVLIRDAKPCYYVYRQTWRDRTQTGLAAVASVADYATNRIRKHEHTTPVKEDDRVRQIEAVNAQTGPVMMGYPAAPDIDAMLARVTAAAPDVDVDVTAEDGVRHQLWVVGDEETIDRIHARSGRVAGPLYRRRASPLGCRLTRRSSPWQRCGLAWLFPRRAVSASRNDDPGLQPRAA